MKHVSWPTKSQTTTYTVLVIVLSLFIAFYLGLFDWIFEHGLDALISEQGTDFDPSEHILDSQSEIDLLKNDVQNTDGLNVTPLELPTNSN